MKKILLLCSFVVFLALVSSVSANTRCDDSLQDDCYIDYNYVLNGSYNIINDAGSDGAIIINGSGINVDCNGTTFKGNDLGYGLAITADDSAVYNCTVDNYVANLYVRTENTSLSNMTLNHTNAGMVNRYGVLFTMANDSNITDSLISNIYTGITIVQGNRTLIQDNTITGTPVAIMAGEGSYYVTIDNNKIYGNISYGVCIGCDGYNGYNYDIKNNLIYSNNTVVVNSGIWGNRLYNSNITSNEIYTMYYGVYDTNKNVRIEKNIINNTTSVGIHSDCAATIGCVIHNNTIKNTTHGIQLVAGGYNITNNIITNNLQGIVVYTGTVYANITGNNISLNKFSGLNWTATTTNATIVYNNYFNNTPVANAFMDSWIWFNVSNWSGTNILGGSILAGNYWDNYNGSDTTDNGLGDTEIPYTSNDNISLGGDYAPLVKAVVSGVTLTIVPSTSVNVGTEVITTCTADMGDLQLKKNGTLVSNPYSSVLPIGVHEFNCTVTVSGYYINSTAQNVTVSTSYIEGCRYTTTYAYKGELVVTDNTTIIDMSPYRNEYQVRSDLKDVWVPSAIQYWTNESRYLIINVSGQIGNNLTVYFGNYLNNITQNVSYSGGLAPTNTFANVTQINNFTLITHLNEITLEEFNPPDAALTYDLYCRAGHTYFDIPNGTNDTRFLFATFSTWNDSTVTAVYGTGVGNSYRRNIIHASPTEYRNMWLMDAQLYTIIQISNNLDDLTGRFDNARLNIKKWIGDQLRNIDQQQFDASGMLYFFGIEGDRYIYEIINEDDEARVLGNVIIDSSDTEKTITISRVDMEATEYISQLEFSYNYSNASGLIWLYYNDPYLNTNNINITIFYVSNGTQVYFADSTADEVTFLYAVGNTSGARYRMLVQVDHNDAIGKVKFWTTLGGEMAESLAFPQTWATLIGMAIVTIFFLAFSPRLAPMGLIFTLIVALALSNLGFLPVPEEILIISIILAIFWWIWREYKK